MVKRTFTRHVTHKTSANLLSLKIQNQLNKRRIQERETANHVILSFFVNSPETSCGYLQVDNSDNKIKNIYWKKSYVHYHLEHLFDGIVCTWFIFIIISGTNTISFEVVSLLPIKKLSKNHLQFPITNLLCENVEEKDCKMNILLLKIETAIGQI